MTSTGLSLDDRALAILNDSVLGVDDQLFPDPEPSRNVFVVGAPRSGTTVLIQALAAAFDVGYISNLAASFWQAPALGVLFSRRLVPERIFSGNSRYGRTEKNQRAA